MAHTDVSNCVLSILSSFSSGLDVFRKLRETRGGGKKTRRSRADQKVLDEELQLSRSLHRGPEDIAREYEKSHWTAGDQFAVGDVIAQTSLAEILLRLNTGLVGIIASFLDRDKKDTGLDYPSLTDLSDRSRVETCKALRQLYKRMSQLQSAPAVDRRLAFQGSEQTASGSERSHVGRTRQRSVATHPKIRGPTIARVVIQDSSKPPQIALVKPKERRTRSHSSSGVGTARVSAAQTQLSSAPAFYLPQLPASPPPYDAPARRTRPIAQRSRTSPAEVPNAGRRPSAADARVKSPPIPPKPEALRSTRSTPRLQDPPSAQPPPLPPSELMLQMATHLPPQAAAMEPRNRRKDTPTYYSIASDSTKLGEIPLHKWAVPFDFDAMSLMNKEAELNGWPVCPLDGEEEDGRKKRRFGLLRIFRKKEVAS